MKQFTIQPEISRFTDPTTKIRKNEKFISETVNAFYHANYIGGNRRWNQKQTFEHNFWILKNDAIKPSDMELQDATEWLSDILDEDLPQVHRQSGLQQLTVVVVPRAKKEECYTANQLLFRDTISCWSDKVDWLKNGAKYIIRHTNTITTHLNSGDGDLPYPGITAETCHISNEIKGKDILLIDDLYTKPVNIDEDCIQALLDKGAKSVIFYAVGKTMSPKEKDLYAQRLYRKPFSALNSQEKERLFPLLLYV
ncbi:MAG: amidophosphoribosyltransferase [Prevotellaceae bacterium]|nr:amidophosphoribosyltransferase [Prevotellaceae bacterium]